MYFYIINFFALEIYGGGEVVLQEGAVGDGMDEKRANGCKQKEFCLAFHHTSTIPHTT